VRPPDCIKLRSGRRGRLTAAPLIAATLVALAGCGTSGPTSAQYAAHADAICSSVHGQIAPLLNEVSEAASALTTGGPAEQQRLASALQRLHGAAESALARLRALQKPSSKGQAEHFLAALGAAVGGLERASTQSHKPDEALAELARSEPLTAQAGTAAKQAGLTSCQHLLGIGATGGASSIDVKLTGENHSPRVDTPWHYTVTVTSASGQPLKGTETTHYTYEGVVVGTEHPTEKPFSGGVYRDTVEFPPAAVGHPLEVQAVVRVGPATATSHWPIEVVK